MEGIIHSVQRFSISDGPGIRSTVFFMGCPLKCIWCSNPDTMKLKTEIAVYAERCLKECSSCIQICPERALRKDKTGKIILNRFLCTHCGKCSETCSTKALEMIGKLVSAEVLLNELLRDYYFYKESGGGVTLSGGEPLFQFEFCYKLLSLLKENDLHITLDTCGFYEEKNIISISNLVDLFFYDLKMIDKRKHLTYTGVTNDIIISNLKILASLGKQIIVRYPFVPGINTSYEDLEKLANLIQDMDHSVEVNLLPYHRLGVSKYKSLGKPYKLVGTPSPSYSELEEAMAYLRQKLINVKSIK